MTTRPILCLNRDVTNTRQKKSFLSKRKTRIDVTQPDTKPITASEKKPITASEKKPITASEKKPKTKLPNKSNTESKQRKEKYRKFGLAYKKLKAMNLPMPIGRKAMKELKAQLKNNGLSNNEAKYVIKKWLRSNEYLTSLIECKHRFNLDGSLAELISNDEKESAKQGIKENKKWVQLQQGKPD